MFEDISCNFYEFAQMYVTYCVNVKSSLFVHSARRVSGRAEDNATGDSQGQYWHRVWSSSVS